MTAYLIRRVGQLVLVLIGVTIVSFGMLFMTGDPAALLAGEDASREAVERIRVDRGFDRPWLVQYVEYVGRAVRGDFGMSYRQRQEVFPLILERVPATARLAFAAVFLASLVSIPLGVLAASRRGTMLDHVSQLFAMVGQAIPAFWLALMLMLLFAVNLRWFPVSGFGGGDWRYLILPALSLSLAPLALQMRMVRSAVLEVQGKDYVRTARAKGLPTVPLMTKHVLRNAFIPVLTIMGLEFGRLISGTVVIESVFAWPGIGRLMLNAIYTKDIPIVMAGLILIAVFYVFINLTIDILYTFFDPRIRYT